MHGQLQQIQVKAVDKGTLQYMSVTLLLINFYGVKSA